MATIEHIRDPSRRAFLSRTALGLSFPLLIGAVAAADQLDRYLSRSAESQQLFTQISAVEPDQIKHLANPLDIYGYDLESYYASDLPEMDSRLRSILQQLAPYTPYLFSEQGILAAGSIIDVAGSPVLASHKDVFENVIHPNGFYAAIPNLGVFKFNANGYEITNNGKDKIVYMPITDITLTEKLNQRNTPKIPEIEKFDMREVFTMHPARNVFTVLSQQPDGTYTITNGIGQNKEGPYTNITHAVLGSPTYIMTRRGPQAVGMITHIPTTPEELVERVELGTGFSCETKGIHVSPFHSKYFTPSERVFI